MLESDSRLTGFYLHFLWVRNPKNYRKWDPGPFLYSNHPVEKFFVMFSVQNLVKRVLLQPLLNRRFSIVEYVLLCTFIAYRYLLRSSGALCRLLTVCKRGKIIQSSISSTILRVPRRVIEAAFPADWITVVAGVEPTGWRVVVVHGVRYGRQVGEHRRAQLLWTLTRCCAAHSPDSTAGCRPASVY